MTIAIDFDGTIVEDRYPAIGPERPFATETLRMLIKDRHQLILWTVREGDKLQEAINWCRERGVEFWAVNRDYPEEEIDKNNHFSRKIKADYFIDDRGIAGLPDWGLFFHDPPAPEIYTQLDDAFIDEHGLTDLFEVVNSVPPLKTDYVPRDSIVREFVGGSCFEY